MMRLDKFLCDLGIGSRKQVKEHIKKGLVKVNDSVVKNNDLKINELIKKAVAAYVKTN